jgi:hypothetical protein
MATMMTLATLAADPMPVIDDAGEYEAPTPADSRQYHAEMTDGGFGPDDLSPSDRDFAACDSYLSRWLDENDPR